MKKSVLFGALTTAGMILAAPSANAALVGGETLLFDAGIQTCKIGGTYPDNCTYGIKTVDTGSYFAMDTGGNPGFDAGERVPIVPVASGTGGVALDGTAQPNGDIDDPWVFGGANLGRHNTTGQGAGNTPFVIAGGDVNMNGWTVFWGAPGSEVNINMGGSGAGIATVDCGAGTCAVGESYTLMYETIVPANQPFEGVPYQLYLEGTVAAASAVPVPAAVWLFGSGLLGLVGVARRKKNA